MTLQFAVVDRTAFGTQFVTVTSGGTLKLFSGSEPTNCAAADPSGLLASGTLPSPALVSSAGVASKTGTWTVTGSASGTAATFRIYDSSAACHIQGTCGIGTGDMTFDNTSITSTQVVTVNTFTITFGNP